MIGAIILLIGWTLVGRRLMQLVSHELPAPVELGAGFLLGNLIIAYTLFSLGWWLPHAMLVQVLTALAALAVVALWPRDLKLTRSWVISAVISAILFVGLYMIVWQQDFRGIALAMRGVWGDWGHHIGLPVYFKFLNHTSWVSPFTAGINFTYSFLNALIPTAMLHLGASVRFSLLITGIVWSVVVSLWLVYFSGQLGIKRLSLLTPLLFFLTGHLGFIDFFRDLQNRTTSLVEFVSHLPREYGHFWEGNFHLGNFLDFFFVSQRAYIFGFGFGVIILWLTLFVNTKASRLMAGVLLGLLPLVHMHSFISILVVVGVWTLVDWRQWRGWLEFWLPAITLASPYFWWLMRANSALASGSFINWKWGWLAGEENWLWFWVKNAPILVTGIIGLKVMPGKLRWLAIGGWMMFLMANLVQLQPNLADNNKLLVWWYLLSGIIPSLFWLERINKWWISLVFVLVTTFSGVLQLVWITQNSWDFANQEDLKLANFATSSCIDRRWLTSDKHNHPVFSFAGRPLVMGYRGWLWTWGVNYTQIETDIKLMYTKPGESAHLFNKYNISYAVVGPSETYEYHPDVKLWHELYPIVYHTPDYLVFAVNPCFAPD